jgi:CheY-like chemotaxis protein
MAVKTALVIDDSKSARIMLSRLVQKNGLEVSMVESGEEGIAFLENNPLPDVIFMDHMMPGMDGLQTTKVITSNSKTLHIPILMYTSKEGDKYEAEVKDSGAYGMLGKPAKPDRLKAWLEELNNRPEAAHTTVDQVTASDETTQTPIVEEEEMSQELIEEVSSKLIARAIEDALQPLSSSLHRLETNIHENQSEIRKLSSRQDNNINLVSQAVLDASLKQTTVQLQAQLTSEIKAIRDLLEQKAELSPAALQQIKDLAVSAGADAGNITAEKAATSAAEAVAAKVAAAQAQFQIQQDMQPFVKQAKKATMISIISILAAGAAIISSFFL